MEAIKNNLFRIIIISIACGTLDFILQGVTSSLHINNLNFIEPSIFVQTGIIYPVLIVYFWIDYAVLASVFVLIQNKLPCSKWTKGFLYGLCFGGLYLIGMYEGILILNDTAVNSTWVGLSDGLPIMLMGTLMGLFTGTSEIQYRKKQRGLSIFIVAFCFVTGRYLSYAILHISSAYTAMPLGTFFWTLFQGLWIGLIYFILKPGIRGKSAVSKALFFGIVVFGLNWLMYHFFMPIMFVVSISDIFVRVGVDMIFTTAGVIICNKLLAEGGQLFEPEIT